MKTVGRKGYGIKKADVDWKQVQRELTVRAAWDPNTAFGPPPKPFKVFLDEDDRAYIPEHWARVKFGSPTGSEHNVEPKPHLQFEGTLKPELRQAAAFEACMAAMKETGGGIAALHTGFGKTVIALCVACSLKVKTLVVVHKQFLMDQWKERIKTFVPAASVGTVQGSTCDAADRDIVVAMLQSLSQRQYDMSGFGLCVVDECVHIGAPCFSQAMLSINCPYKLGLSATPDRQDGLTKVLVWFLGPIFLKVEREEQYRVCVKPVTYTTPGFSAPPPLRRGRIDFERTIQRLCDDDNRTNMIVSKIRALPGDRKVLVLSARREHCKDLVERLGEGAALYMGGMRPDDLREAATSRVVVGTYSIAAEGLDIPALNTLVLATPKKDVVQACGRIMRGSLGDTPPLILDIRDAWPCLNGQWNKRREYYRKAGFTTPGSAAQQPVTSSCLIAVDS